MIQDISYEELPGFVLQHDVVVILITGDYCQPCKSMKPFLSELDPEDCGFHLSQIDIVANNQIAADYSLRGVPTFLVFKEGTLVGKFSGATPQEPFLQRVEACLNGDKDPFS